MTPHAIGGQVSVEQRDDKRIVLYDQSDLMCDIVFILDHEQLANLVQWAKARGLIE